MEMLKLSLWDGDALDLDAGGLLHQIYIYMYIHTYIYIHVYVHVYIHIYAHNIADMDMDTV